MEERKKKRERGKREIHSINPGSNLASKTQSIVYTQMIAKE